MPTYSGVLRLRNFGGGMGPENHRIAAHRLRGPTGLKGLEFLPPHH